MRVIPAFAGFVKASGLSCLLFLGAVAANGGEPTLRALILSGQNNHAWQETTPKLRSILAASGRFAVEVTEHPERLDATSLARFDVLVSDWNTFGKPAVTNWPAPVREAFLAFIKGGKGLVVVHAGGSSFYDWPEYQQAAGAYWQMEQTSHGAPREFTVTPEGVHPITKALAPFKTTDELWVKPGVHPAARVIARGDGEPIAMTTSLGQGRGFALLLGHSAGFMETPGFSALLVRGAQWAATGKVED